MYTIIGYLGYLALIASVFIYIRAKKEKLEKLKLKQREKTDPKVVVLGGGTGQSIFLRGLKKHTKNITAVVTVADDGGGSGVLREDLGMLPPGDIRNCLLALANIEPTMKEIMQYRFEEGGLKGQSFGNLFLAAMNGVYGNFELAVYKLSEIFAITGKVLPVTLTDVKLVAKLKNGETIKGESIIPDYCKENNTLIDEMTLEPKDVKPLDEVLNSIKDADIIVIGPGSLYTSIMPNILVDGVSEAIKNSKAPKVYVSNVMTQPGESDFYNVIDHIDAINKHSKEDLVDFVLSNNQNVSDEAFEKYKKDGANLVMLDNNQKEVLKNRKIKYIEDDFIEVKNNYIRHNANKISKVIVDLARSHKSSK